jgi:PTH1 family peptidyl-tRNA hydrolase
MFLIVGLGNPGERYARHRHNIGFMAADCIHARHGFGVWRKKFQGEVSEGALPGLEQKIILLKPHTFMNLSGGSVQAAQQFYKIAQDHIYALHDDLDIAPGKIKIKQGGGAGGHNGLRSMDEHCGPDYWRVRFGIGHPGVHLPDKSEIVANYVLSDFAKADKAWLEMLLENAAENLPLLFSRGPGDYLGALHMKETKE